MSLEENVRLGSLLDIYGELLSKKQKQMLYDFVIQDMSLGEIALNYNVSRSAVLDAVNKAKTKLLTYEQKLGLHKIKTTLKNLLLCDEMECRQQIKKLLEET